VDRADLPRRSTRDGRRSGENSVAAGRRTADFNTYYQMPLIGIYDRLKRICFPQDRVITRVFRSERALKTRRPVIYGAIVGARAVDNSVDKKSD
jgi:hypothetical protein